MNSSATEHICDLSFFVQAVECRLSAIKPATIHGAGWHERAIYEFKMFAEKAPFVYIQVSGHL
jgi:hypothetical protein